MKISEILGDAVNQLTPEILEPLKDKDYIENDGKMIPKYRFDEVIEQKNTYKENNGQLLAELDKLKKEFKGNDEVVKQLNELKSQVQERDGKIVQITKTNALKEALRMKGARHPDLLLSKFELDKLELEGDKIKNADDLIANVQKEYADLFGDPKIVTTDNGLASPPQKTELTPEDKKRAKEMFSLGYTDDEAFEAYAEIKKKLNKGK